MDDQKDWVGRVGSASGGEKLDINFIIVVVILENCRK